MIKKITRSWRSKYFYGILVAIVIILTPFLLSIHKLFDDTEGISIIYFLGVSYDHHYADNMTFVWSFLARLIPVHLLIIWYLHSPFWWRHFILIPLITFLTSFLQVFYSEPAGFSSYLATLTFVLIILLLLEIWVYKKAEKDKVGLIVNIFNISNKWRRYSHSLKTYLDENQNLMQNIPTSLKVKRLYSIKSVLNEKVFPFNTWNNIVLFKKSDIFIVVILLLIPALYHLYSFFPEKEKILRIGLFTIYDHGFTDVHTFMWYMNLKMCIILPLIVWFITCPYWWRYSILSPIVLFAHQLWEGFQDETISVDESQYIYSLPFIIFLLLGLLFIFKTVKYQSKIMDTYNEVSNQIEKLLAESKVTDNPLKESKLKFTELKKNITEENARIRLKSLVKLKKDLEEIL